jgi:hypothetical protein
MSFWPFPKTLLAELKAGLAHGPGVELGSGEGHLHDRLASAGIDLLRTDLSSPGDVRLDATRLPFGPRRLGLLVAGNLLRHLSASARRDVLEQAARVTADDGRLLLLEDDPAARSRAEANYREALALLARVDTSRGPALDLQTVVDQRPDAFATIAWSGTLENTEVPEDPLAPALWLDAHGGVPAPELAAHRARVQEHGMEYGCFQAWVLRRTARRGDN